MTEAAFKVPYRRGQSISERMSAWTMPVTESGCWIWLGHTDTGGYGMIRISGRMIHAHRASWMMHRGNGQVPSGMKVLHQCDVRCCVNPDHLFLGTQTDNMRDMVKKGRNADTRGRRNGRSKLTEAQVLEIRALPGSHAEIARRYGVGKSIISYIRRGEAWRSL